MVSNSDSLFPSSANNPWPFAGSGNPTYRPLKKLCGVYKMEKEFLTDEGERHDSISLFDARNRWLKEGLEQRIFPIWKTEAFHNLFHKPLFAVLYRKFHFYKANYRTTPGATCEEIYSTLFTYFLEKTSREQKNYTALAQQFGSWAHYPLDSTYKNLSEVTRGILHLYYMKGDALLESAFLKEKKTAQCSLDELTERGSSELFHIREQDRPEEIGTENRNQVLTKLAAKVRTAVALDKSLNKTGASDPFFNYLLAEGSFAIRFQKSEIGKHLNENQVQRLEHKILSVTLPRILSEAGIASGNNSKEMRHILRFLLFLPIITRQDQK